MKTRTFHRILCLLLVICLSTILLAACNKDENPTESNSRPASSGTNSQGNDSFRLEKKDFGGVTIKILTDQATDYLKCELAAETLTADRVNDASYNRAKLIEQEYGIVLEQVYAEHQDGLIKQAKSLIMVNDDQYQILCAGIFYLAQLVSDGMLHDLTRLNNDYLDINQPYWDQNMKDQLSILGSVYFAAGDAIVTDDEATWAVYFNKELANNHNVTANYGVSSLYELVESGKWTLDVMHEMSKLVVNDAGDPGMELKPDTQDTWGTVAQCYDSVALMHAFGQTQTQNVDGKPMIMIDTEANYNAFDKVFNFLKDDSCTAVQEITGKGKFPQADTYNGHVKIFADGKALFTPNRIAQVSSAEFRNASIPYGILPMPKQNEAQDDYYSPVTVYWCSALAIPTSNVENLEATCYAMEALAYYGQRDMTAQFYENTLKDKRFEDPESGPMLDIIFKNRVFDLGSVFNNDILGFYTNLLFPSTNNHVSVIESKKSGYEVALEDIFMQIEEARNSAQ